MKKKSLPAPLHKLVSRRDFLGAGLIAGSSYLIAPRWLDLLLKPAQAANCIGNSAGAMIPFISVDLGGGAGLASNFVAMNAAREPLSSYNKMGLGDNQVPIERAFNNAPFAGYMTGVKDDNQLISKFYKGLRIPGTASFANTAFCGLCVRSRDDNNENPFSVNGLLSKAGLNGSIYAGLGTSASSRSGGRHASAVLAPPTPLRVSRIGDLRNSIGYSGAVGTQLNVQQKSSLANLVNKLNSSQTRKLAGVSTGSQIQEVLECAGIRTKNLVDLGSGNDIDPVTDAAVAAIWGINSALGENDQNRVHAAMIYNALMGNAGSVTIEMGGYDYHDETRTTGDRKDEEAGLLVGRILETARVLGKAAFIYVSTDGSVFSLPSESRSAGWRGDRGECGAAYMLYHDPKGRPAFKDHQLGQFTNAQVVDETTAVGARPDVAATAVFANWLKANGRLDLLPSIAGRVLNGVNTESLLVL